MIVIPAIDLREGHSVQLVGGSYDREAIRFDDPVEVAARWQRARFPRLHIVDLDAATGHGSNRDVIRRILGSTECETQVGGGVRTTEDVDELLRAGADRVITGTRGLEDRAWLIDVAESNPGRVIVAIDIRERRIVIRGWTKVIEHDFQEVVSELTALPLGGLFVTAVHREGMMQGTDLPLMREVLAHSTLPVLAAGGVGTIDDLRALKELGVAAVVVGMALYTGALDAGAVIEEFAQ
ncbi:MAG TPA: 1-(5-phosphoribosyl)-5-[(5-phosphoribosylamino)methylideneamino] imidazole-4-carboxamide isomerase [Gemmatimonadaceae bacterium]